MKIVFFNLLKIVIIILLNTILLQANFDNPTNLQEAKQRAKKLDIDRAIDRQNREITARDNFEGGVEVNRSIKKLKIEDFDTNGCFIFNNIVIAGNKVIPNKIFNKIFNKYLNKCISINIAQEILMEEIINEYQKRGYILAIPYLPEQNISHGVLKIVIQEGILEDIRYDENILSKLSVKGAFFNLIGKPVNIRALEQALENVNSSGAYTVTMDLEPSTTAGYSVLVLSSKKLNSWNYSLGVTNDYNSLDQTFPKTEARGTFSIGVGNIIANDTLKLNSSYTYHNTSDRQAGSLGFNYFIPLGYWTFGLNSNVDMNKTITRTEYSNYISKGKTYVSSIDIGKTLFRDAKHVVRTSLNLNHYLTQNYFDGILLNVSSYNLYYADMSLEYQYFTSKVRVFSSLLYTHGQPLFGEKKQGRNEYFYPQNLFDIIKFNLNSSVSIFPKLTYNNRLLTQYTVDTLYAINDFVVISSQGVRGYQGIYSSYGSGFSNQNELVYDIFLFKNSWINKISILGAIDIGGSIDEVDLKILNEKQRPLIGWYTELRTSGKASFSVGYGEPLMHVKYISKNHKVIKFNFNISI